MPVPDFNKVAAVEALIENVPFIDRAVVLGKANRDVTSEGQAAFAAAVASMNDLTPIERRLLDRKFGYEIESV